MEKKKLSQREFLMASAIGGAGAILAGCAPQKAAAPEPTKAQAVQAVSTQPPAPAAAKGNVVVMKTGTEWSEDALKPFLANNSGITVELVESDTTRFYAMLAAGTPPDIVRTQAPAIPQYLARKILLDLTPWFQVSTLLKPDDLAAANKYYQANGPLEIGGGKIYGMCKDWSPDFTMWLYKKAFEDASVPLPSDQSNLTYQDVMELAKKLTKRQGDRTLVFGYGADSAWTDRFWMNMLAEKNVSLYKDDFTKIDLTKNDESKAVVKWYYDMAKENVMANPLNPSPNWIGDDFNKGILANCQYGFWFGGMAESDVTKGQVIMLPTATWAGVQRDPTITATGYIITAATKVPDAAWKVYEWFMGDQPAKDRAASGWGVPALKSMNAMIPLKTDFDKQKLTILNRELALNTPPIKFNPFLSEGAVVNSWTKNLEQALKGQMTFDELVAAVETEVNAAISDGVMRIG